MAKGIVASGLVLLLAASVTLARPARAGDSCSILERVVWESVYRAATEYKPALPRDKTDSAFQGGMLAHRHACPRTIEVTTGAFTRALADLGLAIRWSPPHPGDRCWSGDLEACYPGPVADAPALPPDQLAFVYDAWQGVQNAVTSHMRRGSLGGVVTFTADSLEASLRWNLQLTVDRPLHLGYARTELPARR